MFLLLIMKQLFNQMMDKNQVRDLKMNNFYKKKDKKKQFILVIF